MKHASTITRAELIRRIENRLEFLRETVAKLDRDIAASGLPIGARSLARWNEAKIAALEFELANLRAGSFPLYSPECAYGAVLID